MKNILSHADFPAISTQKVEWTAVYLEPVMGSGEKITVGVVFQDAKGIRFEPTLQKQQLVCLFGDVAHKIQGLVDSIQQHIISQEHIADLKLPFFGATLGHFHSVAANSTEEVMGTSMAMSSAFIALPEYGNEDEEDTELDVKDEVRETVLQRAPHLKDFFNVGVKMNKSPRKLQFNFAGRRAAVNLAKINPSSNFSTYIDKAKARILDLSSLRKHDMQHPLEIAGKTARQYYDLIIFHPSYDSPLLNKRNKDNVRSVLQLLEDEADKSSVRLKPMVQAQEAVNWIIQQEAA